MDFIAGSLWRTARRFGCAPCTRRWRSTLPVAGSRLRLLGTDDAWPIARDLHRTCSFRISFDDGGEVSVGPAVAGGRLMVASWSGTDTIDARVGRGTRTIRLQKRRQTPRVARALTWPQRRGDHSHGFVARLHPDAALRKGHAWIEGITRHTGQRVVTGRSPWSMDNGAGTGPV